MTTIGFPFPDLHLDDAEVEAEHQRIQELARRAERQPRPRAVQMGSGWRVENGLGQFWVVDTFYNPRDGAYRGSWESPGGMTDHGWETCGTFSEREAHLIAGALRGPK